MRGCTAAGLTMRAATGTFALLTRRRFGASVTGLAHEDKHVRDRTSEARASHQRLAKRIAGWSAAIATGVLLCSPAFGQTVRIDDQLARAVTLSGGDRGRITEFVDQYRAELLSDDRTDVATARAALTDVLTKNRSVVSVAFRQGLAGELSDEVEQLIDAGETWRKLVGLRLAADLATESNVRLVDRAIDDADTSVRFFAMFASETVFDTVSVSSPAVTERTLGRLLERVGTVLAETDDARLADAAVRSIGAAIGVPASRIEGLSARGVSVLASSSAKLALATDTNDATDESVLPLVRAGLILRDFVAVNADLPAESSRETVGYGGDLVAFVSKRVNQANADDSVPSGFDIQLVGIGASLVFFGEQKRAGTLRQAPCIGQVELVEPLEARDFAKFRVEAQRLIGESGVLVNCQGLGFDPLRFDR